MTFAGARIPEHEQILLAIQKASIREGLQLPSGLDGQAFQVEVNHRLFLRQCRLTQQGCDAVSPPGLALSLRQLQQVLLVTECLFLCLLRSLLEALTHCGQMQLFQVRHQRSSDLRGRAHCCTSVSVNNWSKTLRSTAVTCTSRTATAWSASSMASILSTLICSTPDSSSTRNAASTLTSLFLADNSKIFRYCLLPDACQVVPQADRRSYGSGWSGT